MYWHSTSLAHANLENVLKRKARLGRVRRRNLLVRFARDVTASQAAKLVGVNRDTTNHWYREFREAILAESKRQMSPFSGEIELDEPYVGGPKKRDTRQWYSKTSGASRNGDSRSLMESHKKRSCFTSRKLSSDTTTGVLYLNH